MFWVMFWLFDHNSITTELILINEVLSDFITDTWLQIFNSYKKRSKMLPIKTITLKLKLAKFFYVDEYAEYVMADFFFSTYSPPKCINLSNSGASV